MNDNENVQTLTRAIKRNAYQTSNDVSESDETAKNCTMFVVGAAIFFTGFWAVACLVSAVLHDGPLLMLKNLAAAVIGL
ncbi:MAG: hypothetical protein HGA96_07110 [Desulfobulbaceae bacterium]|nr:hypothetical protein [Desulfobulbaceae bacterium]